MRWERSSTRWKKSWRSRSARSARWRSGLSGRQIRASAANSRRRTARSARRSRAARGRNAGSVPRSGKDARRAAKANTQSRPGRDGPRARSAAGMSAPAGRPEAQAGRNAPPATTSSGNTGRPRARRSQQRSMLQVRRPVRCNRRKHPNKTMGGFMHLQSRPDFYRFGADGERLFCGVSGAKRARRTGRKRNPPFFPRPGASGTGFAGK